MTQAQRKFKILLLGESAVGKTALLEQFTHGTFSTHAITLHFDVEIKTMEVGNIAIYLRYYASVVPWHGNPLPWLGLKRGMRRFQPSETRYRASKVLCTVAEVVHSSCLKMRMV